MSHSRVLFHRSRDVVTFPGFVDCIYLDAPAELHLDNGLGDSIAIRNAKYVRNRHDFKYILASNILMHCVIDSSFSFSWSDAVLWNPHLTMESCYEDFVCVENAKV